MAERVLGLDIGTGAVRVVEVAFESSSGRGPGRGRSSPGRSGQGPTVTRVGEVPAPAGRGAGRRGPRPRRRRRRHHRAVAPDRPALPGRPGRAHRLPGRRPGRSTCRPCPTTSSTAPSASRPPTTSRSRSTRPSSTTPSSKRRPRPSRAGRRWCGCWSPRPTARRWTGCWRPSPPGASGPRPSTWCPSRCCASSAPPAMLRLPLAAGPCPPGIPPRCRGAPTPRPNGERTDDAEAIVSIGAGAHHRRRPRGRPAPFRPHRRRRRRPAHGRRRRRARPRPRGRRSGERAAGALESLGADGPDGDLARRAARVVELRLAGILGEVQSSLAYWMAQSERPLRRIVLTGGGARAGDIAGRLGLLVGAPVEWGAVNELEPPEAAAGNGVWADLTVAAGLALGGAAEGWRIDFCPPVKRSFRLTGAMGRRLAVAAAVVLVVLGGLTARSVLALRSERSNLAAQERVNATVQTELGPVRPAPPAERRSRRRPQAGAGRPGRRRLVDPLPRHARRVDALDGVAGVAPGADRPADHGGFGRPSGATRRPAWGRCRSPASASTTRRWPTGSARSPPIRR